MEKVILFGGFGFIGKNLYEILSKKFEVVIVDKYEDSKFLLKYPNIKKYQYDFKNQEILNKIIEKENPEYIINLISIVTADRDLSLFKGLIETNLDILMKIYESTKNSEKLKLMIQFGSGEEYGNIESPYKETDKENPNSPYSIVKLMVTNTAMMLNKNYNYPITVVRPANLFGKYQADNKFIPYIINKLKNSEEVITTPCEQKRDFIYSEKFAKMINIILENHFSLIGEVVNVGSGKSFPLKDIIEYLKKKLNSNSLIKYGAISYRENEMMDFCLDIDKLKRSSNQEIEIDIFRDLDRYIEEVK